MARTHIIIVNYNAGEWLRRSLSSAFEYSAGKITVVDNASVDNSVDLAKELLPNSKRLNWIENTDNLGFAAANNQVLKVIDTEFAVLMNPDCEIYPNTLDLILQEFENHPGMGLASCKILNSDDSIQSSCRRKFPTPWSALSRILLLYKLFPNSAKLANFDYGDLSLESDSIDGPQVEFIEAVSGAFMVVRTKALQDVGLLDEAYFMHCEDLDWCKRFELAKWQVGFVSAATVKHAKGISSTSRPIGVLWNLHKGMLRFFDKFYRDQHNVLFRALVKAGVGVSFLVRSAVTFLRGVFTGIVRK